MVIIQQDCKPDRKANPLIGILLFLISIVLFVFTGPLGLLYGLVRQLFKKGLIGIGEFTLELAISID
ncbi:MAG: hypothetical protein AAF090_02810 [Bacteroidota bacterium]